MKKKTRKIYVKRGSALKCTCLVEIRPFRNTQKRHRRATHRPFSIFNVVFQHCKQSWHLPFSTGLWVRVEQLDHLLLWPTQCQDTSHDDSYILYALLYSSKYRHAHGEGASSRVNTDSGYAPAPTQSVFLYLAITTSHLAPNQEREKIKEVRLKLNTWVF